MRASTGCRRSNRTSVASIMTQAIEANSRKGDPLQCRRAPRCASAGRAPDGRIGDSRKLPCFVPARETMPAMVAARGRSTAAPTVRYRRYRTERYRRSRWPKAVTSTSSKMGRATVKIGHSVSVIGRLKALQGASAHILTIADLVPVRVQRTNRLLREPAVEIEQLLHWYFSRQWIHGEWYNARYIKPSTKIRH